MTCLLWSPMKHDTSDESLITSASAYTRTRGCKHVGKELFSLQILVCHRYQFVAHGQPATTDSHCYSTARVQPISKIKGATYLDWLYDLSSGAGWNSR